MVPTTHHTHTCRSISALVKHRAGVRMHVEDTLSRIEWPALDPIHGNHPPFDPEQAFGRSLDAMMEDPVLSKPFDHRQARSRMWRFRAKRFLSLACHLQSHKTKRPRDKMDPISFVDKESANRIGSEINFADPSMRSWSQLYLGGPRASREIQRGPRATKGTTSVHCTRRSALPSGWNEAQVMRATRETSGRHTF